MPRVSWYYHMFWHLIEINIRVWYNRDQSRIWWFSWCWFYRTKWLWWYSNSDVEETPERIAKKLVSFSEQILREASDLRSNIGETTNMDFYHVLLLCAPIILKVQSLSAMVLYESWSASFSVSYYCLWCSSSYSIP